MSTRKIIFFIIIGIVGAGLLILLYTLSQSNEKQKTQNTKSLSIWVVGDTTEQYQSLFSGFGSYAPEYKNTTLDIRVFPDYDSYQKILLSTLAEGKGPDIFMIEGGADMILESHIEPIPESFLGLGDFEKVYEDIFLPLIKTEGTGKDLMRYLIGVPIGYETLGVFYHKSLIRNYPRTWAEVDTLDLSSTDTIIYPTNLGLSSAYTSDAVDLIGYFMTKNGARDTKTLSNGATGISDYLSYGSAQITKDDIQSSLRTRIEDMEREKLTTVDLFIRGDIAMLIGFPSIIREMEKAEKRAGALSLGDLILTESLPADSLGKKKTNLARYNYLGISKKTENPAASAKLLEYLMTDSASEKAIEAFPLLLSPKRSLVQSQTTTSLSDIFGRTRMDAFIPSLGDEIIVFGYDIKSEYKKIFADYLDRNTKPDINNLIKIIQKNISCLTESTKTGNVSTQCSDTNL